ncbi:MAG: SurA N-terminal domain-containing protein [Alphaproteobacteria bacterium]|nr:SurA N-terminal domain-containing protein [Alphaproteobacteria bacterium]
MISFFNKLADSWVAKLILAVLALSMMAFWGLGGLSNTSNFNGTAITVGSKKISINQLQRAFDTERIKLTQLMGQPLTPKQAIDMGLLSQVIQQQINEALQERIHDELGLTASNHAVQRYVERHPAFKDNLGHFDQNLFNAYLNHTKMNQAQLAQALQKELANQHLANAIRLIAPAPDSLIQYWQNYQNEERDVEALLIKQERLAVNKTPSQTELKDFYDAYMEDFLQPETRNINIVLINPEIISKNITISPRELEETYEEKKHTFDIPEKRDIAQIRFVTEQDAQKALQSLTPGNFEEIAKKNGQTTEATNFGEVAQNELLPELSEAAFQAKSGTLVGPVASSVGWHILLVRKIIPARSTDKATIYAKLKKQLVQSRAYDTMYQTVRDLDDLLGEGLSLNMAAKKLNLPVQSFKNVDISGDQLPENYRNNELLQQVFTSKLNEPTNMVEQENSFLVAEVNAITPASTKSFESVLPELKAKWTQEQQASLLPQVTQKALDTVKAGVIPAAQGEIIIERNIKRSLAKHVPSEALVAIFKQKLGYPEAIVIPLANANLISVVKKVSHPKDNTTDSATVKKQLEQEMSDNMRTAFIADYTSQLGIEINMPAIQKAFEIYKD